MADEPNNIDSKTKSVLAGIDRVFGDTSVPAAVTLARLEDIRDHVQEYMDALKGDEED